ncbi:MAG: MBL fold metallo-hydrolase [Methanobacteriota archaeon]
MDRSIKVFKKHRVPLLRNGVDSVRLKFLGVHHEESKNTRLVSFLIDNILAVDAGSLASALSFSEQEKIKAILLSHAHYDHIKGVPSFIFNNLNHTTKILASPHTLKILSSNLFDGVIYPKFTGKTPFLKKSPIKLIALQPFKPTTIEGYHVLPLPINHTTGSIGFEITSKDGKKKFFYSGDTGPGLSPLWRHISPQLIIIDVTFPNSLEQTAKNAAHLCPKMLNKELQDFLRIKGYLPKILLIHLNPKYEKKIKEEIQGLAKELNHPITITREGDTLTV